MTDDELSLITRKLVSGDTSNNIGIYNVQTRLYLYYGKEYGIEMSSIHGEGTIIKLRIPMQT
jgi:two-component system sensor histidine kinase YesM